VTTIIPKGDNVNMAPENNPYREKFPLGSNVRIKDAARLEDFKRTWKLHHPISSKQIACGGRLDRVVQVGFYQGGDVIYQLKSAPGTWHEELLERA
jgi:hypothetical protein